MQQRKPEKELTDALIAMRDEMREANTQGQMGSILQKFLVDHQEAIDKMVAKYTPKSYKPLRSKKVEWNQMLFEIEDDGKVALFPGHKINIAGTDYKIMKVNKNQKPGHAELIVRKWYGNSEG